jgi:hypothetical protein
MKYIFTLFIVLAGGVAFAGGGSSVGPSNPAMNECRQTGAATFGLQLTAGVSGFCQFGSAVIEEWTFYAARTGRASMAVSALLTNTSGPAAGSTTKICQASGGVLQNFEASPGFQSTYPGTYELCIFPDRSSIGSATLANGRSAPANKALVDLIAQHSI